MDDIFGPFVVIGVIGLAIVGAFTVFGDFRHFDSVKEQCVKQGYIQDKTTRIVCSVEPGGK